MSRLGCYDHHHENGFPRVSGDEPVSVATTTIMKTFSPRERG